MNRHLDDEQATYYVYGLAEPDERGEIERHLVACAECTGKVHQLETEKPKILAAIGQSPVPPGLEATVLALLKSAPVSAMPSRNRAWLAIPASLAAALFLGFLLLVPSSPRNRIERGTVACRRGERWVASAAGTVLRSGDRLRADGPDTAWLALEDGSRISLTPGTTLEFHGGRGENPILSLVEGSARCTVEKGERSFSLSTPSGMVTVLGTEFIVEIWNQGDPAMKKSLLVGGPIVVGVAVLTGSVMFRNPHGTVELKKGESATATESTSPEIVSPKEFSRLKHEVETLRTELTKERERADIAQAELAKLKPPSTDPERTPPDSAEAVEGSDWRHRNDPEFEAVVHAIAWKKNVQSLLLWLEEIEKSRRENRAPQMNQELIADLTDLNSKSMELAKRLGLKSSEWMKIYGNDLVLRCWNDALLEVLAGEPLNEQQMDFLRRSGIYANEASPDEVSSLQRWSEGFRYNFALLTETKGVLTPEQHARLSERITTTFLISEYQERTIEAPSPQEAVRSIAGYWTETMKLPAGTGSAVAQVADEYVRDYATIVASYPTTLTKEQELERSRKLLELQIQAEQKLAERLPLSEEEKSRLQKGSGSALRLEFPQ